MKIGTPAMLFHEVSGDLAVKDRWPGTVAFCSGMGAMNFNFKASAGFSLLTTGYN